MPKLTKTCKMLQAAHFHITKTGLRGGGGVVVRPMILAIIMCTSTGFYNLATSIAFPHDLYLMEDVSQDVFHERGERSLVVA